MNQGSMEKSREPRNKHMLMWQLIYDKKRQEYKVEKIASSINGAGKTEQLHAKEWNGTILLHHILKHTKTD